MSTVLHTPIIHIKQNMAYATRGEADAVRREKLYRVA